MLKLGFVLSLWLFSLVIMLHLCTCDTQLVTADTTTEMPNSGDIVPIGGKHPRNQASCVIYL